MKFRTMLTIAAFVGLGVLGAGADMRITEWMYSGNGGEFVEFTNVGPHPIDMTGWSFEDSNHPSGTPSYFSLSGFGIVAPGESVIITEDTATTFRLVWNLDPSVKVLGSLGQGSGHNLGRSDTIHLLDQNLQIVDILVYGDQTFPGSIRTQYASGNPATPAALGANDVYQWVLSYISDEFGSYASTSGDLGNPGAYIPEPSSLVALLLGAAIVARRRVA